MVGAVPVVLLAFAFVFALAAAFRWNPVPRIDPGWMAFMFFIACLLLGGPLSALLMR